MFWNFGGLSFNCWSAIITFMLYITGMEVEGKTRLPGGGAPQGPVTYDVKLFTERMYEGKMLKLRIEADECVNLPPAWDGEITSVDPEVCIMLYAEADCRGFRKRLDKWSFGSSNLKDIAFENKLSSISTCPTLKKPVVPDEL